MILMIENCSTKMKDVVSGGFHVAFRRLPPLSRSLCLTLMVRHKMWPVDVHLSARKTHFSYASNFIWMTLLPGQGLALSLPPFLFSHFFISPLTSLIFFTIRIASTQGRPPPRRSPFAVRRRSCAKNYHNSYNHFLFFFFFFLPDSFQDERCRK